MDSQGKYEMTIRGCMTYLKTIKDSFNDGGETYKMFFATLMDFKGGRIDTTGVMARAKELFKGHNDLILGLNCFLPKGYEIIPDKDEPIKTESDCTETISYVPVFDRGSEFSVKVKERLGNVDEYMKFLKCVQEFPMTERDLKHTVNGILGEHCDLMDEFYWFLENVDVDEFLDGILSE